MIAVGKRATPVTSRQPKQRRSRERADDKPLPPLPGWEEMPGGVPRGSSSARGEACDVLGEADAKRLIGLRNATRDVNFAKQCQARSSLLRLLQLRRRLATCAVVGSSGILAVRPRGPDIENAEAIFRVNNAPVQGFEHMVGMRTTARFVNSPLSHKWAEELGEHDHHERSPPPELEGNAHILSWGTQETRKKLAKVLPPSTSIANVDGSFRQQCVERVFFTQDELEQHRQDNKVNKMEITFGFEAVAHALFACEKVTLYGFFLGGVTAIRGREVNITTAAPYHYFENNTFDVAAKDPWRPWTYQYHNFELEHHKYQQLEHACWLKVEI